MHNQKFLLYPLLNYVVFFPSPSLFVLGAGNFKKKKILFCHFMTLSVEVVVNVYVLSIMPNEKLPLLVFNLFYILKYDLFLVYFIFRFFVRFSKPKRKF